ncbi:Tn3 family transposase [Nocardioides sp. NPDC047086]|uniref:Tn3 family transposase n=1 Tax=Nocardioides sp. NPDC047086 TaxID=3154810 RepID=UPI0033C0ABD7
MTLGARATDAETRDLIETAYDAMIKYAGAIKTGTASTEAILRRFMRTPTAHPAYQGMIELGDSGPLGPPRAITLLDFLEAHPGYGISVSAIVATLERRGTIRTQGEPVKGLAWRSSHVYNDQLPHRYRVSVFGHELLDRLREAVDGPAAPQTHVAEDEQ